MADDHDVYSSAILLKSLLFKISEQTITRKKKRMVNLLDDLSIIRKVFPLNRNKASKQKGITVDYISLPNNEDF